MIELEMTSSDGKVERKEVAVEHATNLLRLSKERGWNWRLPADSQYAFDEKTNTIYRKKNLRKPSKKD